MTSKKESLTASSLSTIGVAIGSALVAGFVTHALHSNRQRKKIDSSSSSSTEEEEERANLGPDITPETRYQLALRGQIDKIYEYHGPKPFEFNAEVVGVFDDMVSRSVPLYCDVIDLAIYWFQKYYQPSTKLYDLGCSTGTTIDVLARSLHGQNDGASIKGNFVGIDNSSAMVDSCRKKLQWAIGKHSIEINCGDILDLEISNASFVIMNYTLQFIPVPKRQTLLQRINDGTCNGGVLFISEKVRAECSEMQETCTSIYEDFKHRRGYTKREIARKKEALMNVLVPYTESELKYALNQAGYHTVEIIAKWNNFTTFVARKKTPAVCVTNNFIPVASQKEGIANAITAVPAGSSPSKQNHNTRKISPGHAVRGVSKFVNEVANDLEPLKWQVVGYEPYEDGTLNYDKPYHNMSNPNDGISKIVGMYNGETKHYLQVLSSTIEQLGLPQEGSVSTSSKRPQNNIITQLAPTPNLDLLLDEAPVYLAELIRDNDLLESFLEQRLDYFSEKGGASKKNLETYDEIAKMILDIPELKTKNLVVNESSLVIGHPDELTEDQMALFQKCIHKLKPWKKGPLHLFGTEIDTEWRSDWKWERLQKSLPDLTDKVICDLGCGNGYFMYRMLEYHPKLVVGIDPNLHAFLEFKLFQRTSGVDNVKFEYLRGDCMTSFPNTFDVVYCLGVLYHTNDPIGMLKDIHKSMKGNSVSFFLL